MAELKRKAAALGDGLGLMAAAAVLAFLAVLFGLAAAAAGLDHDWPVWASLLVVCGALLLIVAILGVVGVPLAADGLEAAAEQAVEEARARRAEALRDAQRSLSSGRRSQRSGAS